MENYRPAYAGRSPVTNLEILFEDDFCIVVNKPAGLLTQAPLGIDSLEVRVKRHLHAKNPDAEPYLGVPHRLDRPVSGAIVFAKSLKAAQRLSKQFENRRVEKTYWALVAGAVEPAAGTWTDRLKKVACEPRAIIAPEEDPEARIAILHYRVLRDSADGVALASSADDRLPRTLLAITLETGRNHQIRIQCASRGHPLVGDELYGSRIPFGPWSDDERERLIALHARRLKFWHHTARTHIAVEAALPDYWRAAGVSEAAVAPPESAD